ncbi:MAG: hypothetical protein WC548_04315 [Candidatus Pacearchaeota archaeon]
MKLTDLVIGAALALVAVLPKIGICPENNYHVSTVETHYRNLKENNVDAVTGLDSEFCERICQEIRIMQE